MTGKKAFCHIKSTKGCIKATIVDQNSCDSVFPCYITAYFLNVNLPDCEFIFYEIHSILNKFFVLSHTSVLIRLISNGKNIKRITISGMETPRQHGLRDEIGFDTLPMTLSELIEKKHSIAVPELITEITCGGMFDHEILKAKKRKMLNSKIIL